MNSIPARSGVRLELPAEQEEVAGAADTAAAELTGSPAALAAALERLTEARERPETDLREWERSAAVMDILPPAEPGVSTGPFRTHPPTEERVEYLNSLTESAETSR